VRAFPPEWRERFEDEVLALIGQTPERRWQTVDLLRAGLGERAHRLVVRCDARAPVCDWFGCAVRIALPAALAVIVGLAGAGVVGLGSGSGVSRLLTARRSVVPGRQSVVLHSHSVSAATAARLLAATAKARQAGVVHGHRIEVGRPVVGLTATGASTPVSAS
jgi:hypothetical protein